jgi:hypothetical protein
VDDHLLGTTIAVNPTPVSGSAELGHTLDGMMQQRFVVPARLRSLVVPAVPGLSADLAILAEPLASAHTCGEILKQVSPPFQALVVGRGTVGQLLRLTLPATCPSVQYVRVTGTRHAIDIEPGTFDAAILCSSREDAPRALRIGLHALRDGGILYLFGGISSDYRDPNLPGAELGKIRSRHSGGYVGDPLGVLCQTAIGNKRVAVTGHRGCSNAMLTRAMSDLATFANVYRGLLRIVDDPHEAVRALEDAIAVPPIRSWTKLGIDLRGW